MAEALTDSVLRLLVRDTGHLSVGVLVVAVVVGLRAWGCCSNDMYLHHFRCAEAGFIVQLPQVQQGGASTDQSVHVVAQAWVATLVVHCSNHHCRHHVMPVMSVT
jgi:hypothetical protein